MRAIKLARHTFVIYNIAEATVPVLDRINLFIKLTLYIMHCAHSHYKENTLQE